MLFLRTKSQVMNPQSVFKTSILVPIFVLLAFIVAVMLVHASQSGAGIDMSSMSYETILGLKVAQLLSVVLLFVVPSVIFSFSFTTQKMSFLEFKKPKSFLILLLVFLMTVFALPLVNGLAVLNESMSLPASFSEIETWMRSSEENLKLATESFLQMPSIIDLLINLIVIAFAAAFTEELFFRGVVQKTFGFAMNHHVAIWITAILFSALHAQYFGFIPRMVLGAVLGYLFYFTNNLWIPIFAHFVNNGMAVIMAYLIQHDVISEDIEKIGSTSSEMILAVISGIVVVGFLIVIKKMNRSKLTLDSETKLG